jgi:tyrosine-protein kinase Etk/Wzc
MLPRAAARAVRSERDLEIALGEPLLAARPDGAQAVRILCDQLSTYWLAGGRRLVPIVDAGNGDGGKDLAVELASAFAARRRRTLLVDADLRSPGLHERFGLPLGQGLADFLEGRGLRLAFVRGKDLALLSAGRLRADPLELLSRGRLTQLLRAAAQPFDVVLVRTTPAARGPDFEIFAALAGGAIVVAPQNATARDLSALRARLARCAARVIGTVLGRG